MFDATAFIAGGLVGALATLVALAIARWYGDAADCATQLSPRYGEQFHDDMAAALADAECAAISAQHHGFATRIQQLRRELAQAGGA